MTYDAAKSQRVSNVLMRSMITKLLHTCGVSFIIYIKKDGFEFTSLVGNDKKKLLNNLLHKISICQPPDYSKTVQKIWEV